MKFPVDTSKKKNLRPFPSFLFLETNRSWSYTSFYKEEKNWRYILLNETFFLLFFFFFFLLLIVIIAFFGTIVVLVPLLLMSYIVSISTLFFFSNIHGSSFIFFSFFPPNSPLSPHLLKICRCMRFVGRFTMV